MKGELNKKVKEYEALVKDEDFAFRINSDLKKAFSQICENNSINKSKLIRKWIVSFVLYNKAYINKEVKKEEFKK